MKSLSTLTPWLAAMLSIADRERERLSITASCQKRGGKINNKNERTALVMWTQLCCQWKRHKKPAKQSIKEMIILLLSHTVTITQLDLYLRHTNDSFSSTLFIPPDNHLSISLTLNTLPHSCTQSPPSIRPQYSDLAPAVSHWSLWQ